MDAQFYGRALLLPRTGKTCPERRHLENVGTSTECPILENSTPLPRQIVGKGGKVDSPDIEQPRPVSVTQFLKAIRELDDQRLDRDAKSEDHSREGGMDIRMCIYVLEALKSIPPQIGSVLKAVRMQEARQQYLSEIIACQDEEAAALELLVLQKKLNLIAQSQSNVRELPAEIMADVDQLRRFDNEMRRRAYEEQAWFEKQIEKDVQRLTEEEQTWLDDHAPCSDEMDDDEILWYTP